MMNHYLFVCLLTFDECSCLNVRQSVFVQDKDPGFKFANAFQGNEQNFLLPRLVHTLIAIFLNTLSIYNQCVSFM